MQAKTISDVRYLNAEAGHHFFDKATMRSFNCRIESGLSKQLRFITSESYSPTGKRKFTVRQYNSETHGIETVGKFMEYHDKETASYAMRYASAPEKDWNYSAVGGVAVSDIPVSVNCR